MFKGARRLFGTKFCFITRWVAWFWERRLWFCDDAGLRPAPLWAPSLCCGPGADAPRSKPTEWCRGHNFGYEQGFDNYPMFVGLNSKPQNEKSFSEGSLCDRSEKLLWLRGLDLNQRPSGYEPDELPGCSTPRQVNFWNGYLYGRSVKTSKYINNIF